MGLIGAGVPLGERGNQARGVNKGDPERGKREKREW